MTTSHERQPRCVFILGVMGRSGTNFLSDALAIHECIKPVQGIWEDYIVQNLQRVEEFVQAVSEDWRPEWDAQRDYRQRLSHEMHAACIRFLRNSAAAGEGQTALTKSPSVENLQLVQRLPDSRVLVLVRDGRDVIESAMRTFAWSFENACARWRRGAETICDALQAKTDFLLVRYEDLFLHFQPEMLKILRYLRLSDTYDFHRAEELPIRGSSAPTTDARNPNSAAAIHWQPIPRSDDFRPIGRWLHWPEAQQAAFETSCGQLNRSFGYEALYQ